MAKKSTQQPAASCSPQEAQKFEQLCNDPACKQCVEDEIAKCFQQHGIQPGQAGAAGAAGLDLSRLSDAAMAGIRAFLQTLLGGYGGAQGGAQAGKP